MFLKVLKISEIRGSIIDYRVLPSRKMGAEAHITSRFIDTVYRLVMLSSSSFLMPLISTLNSRSVTVTRLNPLNALDAYWNLPSVLSILC